MARKVKQKELTNSRLLKDYASWVYCTNCQKTVAYLCYVTYDLCELNYTCNCGSQGRVFIEFDHEPPDQNCQPLALLKNRLCCPGDSSPLLTIVEKNVKKAAVRVVCNSCNEEYGHQYQSPALP